MGRQQPATPSDDEPIEEPRVSVMDWLLDVGHVVARRLRGRPSSP